MDIISTKQVAQVLGVSEATVKRWSDAGTLRCFRTPGGHRKFRLRDVKAFLADQAQGDAPEPQVAPPSQALTPEQAEARKLALDGDVDGLVSLVATHRLRGDSLASTFDRIVAPAMADIGEGWAQGKLSAAQEHIASNTVGDMLARVRPLVERSARVGRGRALVACLAGEQHDIAARMIALVLAAEGFHTSMLGANVPAGDLALMVAGHRPVLLALSASAAADPAALRSDLALVASAAVAGKAKLVVGGAGFAKLPSLPSGVHRFGSLEELVRFAAAPAETKEGVSGGGRRL
jgi:excisionase family DNA binding protein